MKKKTVLGDTWVTLIDRQQVVIVIRPQFVRPSHKPGPQLVLDLGVGRQFTNTGFVVVSPPCNHLVTDWNRHRSLLSLLQILDVERNNRIHERVRAWFFFWSIYLFTRCRWIPQWKYSINTPRSPVCKNFCFYSNLQQFVYALRNDCKKKKPPWLISVGFQRSQLSLFGRNRDEKKKKIQFSDQKCLQHSGATFQRGWVFERKPRQATLRNDIIILLITTPLMPSVRPFNPNEIVLQSNYTSKQSPFRFRQSTAR